MVRLAEVISRIKFWNKADRLGPDMLSTYWQLYFLLSMEKLCKKKFKKFGARSQFRPGAYAIACSKITIGEDVIIRPGTQLYADPTEGGGEIIIEDKVLIGPGVQFHANNHKFADLDIPIFDQGYPLPTIKDSIILRRGCWIGAGSIILAGVEVGKNSVVGAGTIVLESVPPNTLFAGNPGRVKRFLISS